MLIFAAKLLCFCSCNITAVVCKQEFFIIGANCLEHKANGTRSLGKYPLQVDFVSSTTSAIFFSLVILLALATFYGIQDH